MLPSSPDIGLEGEAYVCSVFQFSIYLVSYFRTIGEETNTCLYTEVVLVKKKFELFWPQQTERLVHVLPQCLPILFSALCTTSNNKLKITLKSNGNGIYWAYLAILSRSCSLTLRMSPSKAPACSMGSMWTCEIINSFGFHLNFDFNTFCQDQKEISTFTYWSTDVTLS